MEISDATIIDVYKELNERMQNCLHYEKMWEWYPEQKEEYFQLWQKNQLVYRTLRKVIGWLTGHRVDANEKGIYLDGFYEDDSKYVYRNPSYRGEEVTC